MTQAIIYLQDGGLPAVVYPAPEVLQEFGIEAIAQKDVPAGKPYMVVDVTDIPEDRAEREVWATALLANG